MNQFHADDMFGEVRLTLGSVASWVHMTWLYPPGSPHAQYNLGFTLSKIYTKIKHYQHDLDLQLVERGLLILR